MNDFLIKLKIFAQFIISAGLIYISVYYPLNFLLSIFLITLSIFIIFQLLGNIDKLNHYGPYNNTDSDSSDNNPYISNDKHKHHNNNNTPNVNVNLDINNNPYSNNNTDDINDAVITDDESSLIDFDDFME